MRRLLCPALALAALAAAGCGEDDPAPDRFSLRTPPEHVEATPDPAYAKAQERAQRSVAAAARGARESRSVLEAWAAALSRGDDDRAARYFGLPAVVTQDQTIVLETRAQAEAFTSALPCGVRLLHVQHARLSVVGTFELRPRKAGGCRAAGSVQRIVFVIRDGHIVEYQRLYEVATPTPTPTPGVGADQPDA